MGWLIKPTAHWKLQVEYGEQQDFSNTWGQSRQISLRQSISAGKNWALKMDSQWNQQRGDDDWENMLGVHLYF